VIFQPFIAFSETVKNISSPEKNIGEFVGLCIAWFIGVVRVFRVKIGKLF